MLIPSDREGPRTNQVRDHNSMCDNKDLMDESHDIQ